MRGLQIICVGLIILGVACKSQEPAETTRVGEHVMLIQQALQEPDSADTDAIITFGQDSRYYTMVRGWLGLELRAVESQLDAGANSPAQRKRQAWLIKVIRHIDLE